MTPRKQASAPESRNLAPSDRAELLRIARAAIAGAIEQLPAVSPLRHPGPGLLAPCAAFVSLHLQGRLRGCVGTLEAEHVLWKTVSEMAIAAARKDPRFPPLTKAELELTRIEISRLTVPRLARPHEVVPGQHGVCIEYGGRRAVFLPQVATTHGWCRETLLDETCLKASLPREAWRDPKNRLLIFEAEVFADQAGA